MEQTSSTSYPNVLVVDYLSRARVARPDVMMRAQEYLNLGYQRILTFQTAAGGFGWWQGQNEPVLWVTAYGLHQLADTARVHEIDPNVIERARQWIYSQQAAEGSWSNAGATHGERVASMPDPRLPLTSYVAWALILTDDRSENASRAVAFIRQNVGACRDVYTLALAANALAAWDADDDSTREVVNRLLDGRHDEGDTTSFGGEGQTFTYAHGDSAQIETTALAALAMMRARLEPGITQRAIRFLVQSRDASGRWGSTQPTILALKALNEAMGARGVDRPTRVEVRLNGQVRELTVTPDNADMLHTIDLGDATVAGPNRVEVAVDGETAMLYQVATRYYLPWASVEEEPSPIEVNVEYDRTRLTMNDELTATVTMRYRGEIPTYMVLLDLGIPPGFDVDRSSFEKLVADGVIQRFGLTSRQATLYFGDVAPGAEWTFSYVLRPRYPLRAQAPNATAWEYYSPDVRAESHPTTLEVTD